MGMTMWKMTSRTLLGAAIASAAFACSKPADAPAKVPLGSPATAPAPAGGSPAPVLSAEAKRALDSGNFLFRAGSAAKKKSDAAGAKQLYAEALLQYRRSAKDSPDHAAPWFGVQMVAKEQGNKALADSAFAAIRARNTAPAGTAGQHDMSDSTLNKLRTKMKGAPPIG
jgi:hypothetical protein